MFRYLFVLSTSLLFLFTGCQTKQVNLSHDLPHGCAYYTLKSAQCLSEQHIIKSLEPYKVIFIGDHHDQKDLHTKVAQLISSLSRSGVKVKLANEWFYPSDNANLNAYVSNDINETEFLKKIQWEKRLGYYPFDSFKPMYEAVKSHQGKLYGINLSKEARKKISDNNLSAMNAREQDFNAHLDTKVSAHKALIMPYLSHCHAPKKDESIQECSKRMYKVQVAWDSKMALESYKLSQKLQKNEKLIVFAGAMHIESNLGIPLRFARLSNIPFVSILPADTKTNTIDHKIADFILFYHNQQKNKE